MMMFNYEAAPVPVLHGVSSSASSSAINKRQSVISVLGDAAVETPVPAVIDNLRTVHSRQGRHNLSLIVTSTS